MSIKMNAKLNINNLCRTCLIQLNDMFSIFDYVQIKDTSDILISHILMECASIEIISDDSLPKNICTDCLSMAKQSYLFKQTCQNAQKYLTDIIEKDNCGFQVPLHSELIIKKDLLDDINNDDSYNNEETFSGNDYLDTKSDKAYDSNEQTNSSESEHFRGFDKNKTFDHGGFLSNVLDYGEPSQIKSEVKSEVSTFMNDPCDNTEKGEPKQDFESHTSSHGNNNVYVCNICGKVFGSHKSLSLHMRLEKRKMFSLAASQRKSYCCFCDTVLTFQYFVDHIKACEKKPESFTKEDCLICPICKKQTSSRRQLLAHRVTFHPKNVPKYDDVENNTRSEQEQSNDTIKNNSHCNFCDCLIETKFFFNHLKICEKRPKNYMELKKRNILNSRRQREDYCCFCDTVFSSQYFDHHIKTCDKKPESYNEADSLTCPICKQQTTKRCTLLTHRIESHKKKLPNYVNIKNNVQQTDTIKNSRYCNFCDSFMHCNQFLDHLNKCEKKPENCTLEDTLRCPICKILIHKPYHLTKHRVNVHPDNLPDNYYESVLECKNCHQKFLRYCTYKKHLDVCKVEDGQFEVVSFKEVQKKSEQDTVDMFKMYCKLCKIRFTQEEVFNQHIEQHGNMNVYLCKICGNIYKSYFLLTLHVQIHGEREKYLCSVCGKDFISPKNVQIHMRVHTGEKPFACDKCEMRFTQKSSLKSHLKNHSDVKEYKCWICDVTFKRCNQFTIHMRDHKETFEGKQFTCEICTRTFTSSIKLKSHLTTHKKRSQIHLCKTCDRTFSSGYALKVHTRLHTGEKPYICPVCKKGFPQGVSLRSHMKQHKKLRVKKSHKKIKQENVQ